MDASVNTMFPGERIIFSINPSPVTTKDRHHEDSPIVKLNDMAVHSICCKLSKMVKIPEMSKASTMDRARATKLRVVENHLHMMRWRLPIVERYPCIVTANYYFTILVANWVESRNHAAQAHDYRPGPEYRINIRPVAYACTFWQCEYDSAL